MDLHYPYLSIVYYAHMFQNDHFKSHHSIYSKLAMAFQLSRSTVCHLHPATLWPEPPLLCLFLTLLQSTLVVLCVKHICASLSLHFWFICVLVALSCPTLCNAMDCNPPGCSVHGIFQASILEWVAIFLSRGSSWPRDWTRSPALRKDSLPSEPPGKPLVHLWTAFSSNIHKTCSLTFSIFFSNFTFPLTRM